MEKMRDEFLLLHDYSKAINELVFDIKKDILAFLLGEIKKSYLNQVKKKELEEKIKKIKSLYKEIKENKTYKIFDKLITDPIKKELQEFIHNNKEELYFEIENFNLKPLTSTLEKIIRYVFSKQGDEGISLSDIVRNRILVPDNQYWVVKHIIPKFLVELARKEKDFSLVHHGEFKVYVNNNKAKLTGLVFESLSKKGKIYYYNIKAKDHETAKEIHKVIKRNLKGKTRKIKEKLSLYKIEMDKCYEEIFKGANIYLKLQKDEIILIFIEDSLLNKDNMPPEYLEKTINKIVNKDFQKEFGLLVPNIKKPDYPYYSFAVRPHIALEKIEVPYVFKELGIETKEDPGNSWFEESIIDEKDLSDIFFKAISRVSSFYNINFVIGNFKCEDLDYTPIGEIQVLTFSTKRLDNENPNFNHKNYELERLKKQFITPLQEIVSSYSTSKKEKKDLFNTIISYLDPLLENSVYEKYYFNLKENGKKEKQKVKIAIREKNNNVYLELYKV